MHWHFASQIKLHGRRRSISLGSWRNLPPLWSATRQTFSVERWRLPDRLRGQCHLRESALQGRDCARRNAPRKIEHGTELPTGSVDEVALRAAALCGVEAVVQAVADAATRSSDCHGNQQERLSPNELGNYLWGILGKELRHFPRIATKTVFY